MNNLAKINLDNYKPLRDVVFEKEKGGSTPFW